MGSVVLASGAGGALVRTLQEALRTGGHELVADGVYGAETAATVRRFQEARGLPPTGETDRRTWEAATHAPPPGLPERALQIIASFEGHDYDVTNGNFDGAGITWGIVGFTLASGSLQRVIQDAIALHPRLIALAFGRDAVELCDVLRLPLADQIVWADRISEGGHKVDLVEPWGAHFRFFGRLPVVKEIQRRRVLEDSFAPARLMAEIYELGSELGVTLCFDILVREGGTSPESATAIARGFRGCESERELRVLIANAVADDARPARREEVRQRLITIATGAGTVHGDRYVLRSWGLDETAAAREVGTWA